MPQRVNVSGPDMPMRPRIVAVVPRELPENAPRQDVPGILFVAGGVVSVAILRGVLAWPVARFAAHPAKVWLFAIMVGAGIGIVVAPHRAETVNPVV